MEGIKQPEGGWKKRTYYKVLVKLSKSNVEHTSIFFSGYLHNGKPSGYNKLFNPSYDRHYEFCDIYAMRVQQELFTD